MTTDVAELQEQFREATNLPLPTGPTLTVTVGPRNAYTDPQSGLRFYRWRGRDYPSVTSLRRMAGLPFGLHQWSINQVIGYAIDHQADIAKRLSTGDPGELQVVRHELRGAATAERDRAADLGTAVHDAAASGRAITDVPPEVAPRLRQYLDWLGVSGAEILAAEFQVFNPAIGYAGTADLICRLRDGSVWLVDLKTGKGTYSEHGLQLMAYSMAEFVGSDDVIDFTLTNLLKDASGMAILHLADDHWEFRAIEAGGETWAAFRGLLTFAVWLHRHASIDSITAAVRSSSEGAA